MVSFTRTTANWPPGHDRDHIGTSRYHSNPRSSRTNAPIKSWLEFPHHRQFGHPQYFCPVICPRHKVVPRMVVGVPPAVTVGVPTTNELQQFPTRTMMDG
jgi:hypothetical protein